MPRFVSVVLSMLLIQAATARETVPTAHEDPSMLLFRATGVELASSEIALALAEMIFRKIYGDADFETERPLRLKDGGDRWIIDGSRSAEDHPASLQQVSIGAAHIEILKANCQVVKLSQKGYLRSPDRLQGGSIGR
ncbi:exported hypothetical protein [Bradyrhizobium sp. STM 3843]|uniref:NTF2 fold immunity protein n=1 Tax=Bradyrhizobium sp. STM 3843 TaxID=551947 RepID=UPI00024036CE|nr:NTF2 fold immunity protein [Bradyrhizobium sp. STM 3843]CCE09590.1 exported hypothetical protein [Bradyrhizobium sp. STM 3843]